MDAFHLYLDSTDVAALKALLPNPLVYGVTTNPTLLKRAGVTWRNLPRLADELFSLGVRAVHLRVVGETADEMVRSGLELVKLGEPKRIFIKVPASREGLVAAAQLTAEGCRRHDHGSLSARAGALFSAGWRELRCAVSGRLEDAGEDGLAVIRQMQTLLERYTPTPTCLLVASVRTREAVLSLLDLGVGSLTLPPTLFTELLHCETTEHAAATFLSDARSLR